MAVLHRNAVGMRADRDWRWLDAHANAATEHLLNLALDLRLFVLDVRHDVAEDVQRRHAGIARTRYRLHRRDEQPSDAEGCMQRRQWHDCHDRRAVGIRHDAATPSAIRPLCVEQGEVIGIDLGNDEWNVLLHAKILRIAEDHTASRRKCSLHVARDGRVERGEHDRRRDLRRIARAYDHPANILRHVADTDPRRRVGIGPPGGPL